MKKLLLCFTFLITHGCSASQSISSPVASDCPEKPTTVLHKKDIEEISLNEQKLTKSSLASANKSIGYKFAAQSGQQLSYTPDPNICIWIYTPNNQLLKSEELPETGNYIIQISALKDSITFDLKMSLSILQASPIATPSSPSPSPTPDPTRFTPPPSPSPTPNPTRFTPSPSPSPTPNPTTFTPPPSPTPDPTTFTPPPSPTPNPTRFTPTPTPSPTPNPTTFTPTPSPTPNPTTFTPATDLTQQQALKILYQWHAAKSRIFAPPFDENLVNQLTTGKLHLEITKPDGYVVRLQNNNSYYTFTNFQILDVINFQNFQLHPSITVAFYEDITLYNKNEINSSASGKYREIFTYYFENENGTWKISHITK